MFNPIKTHPNGPSGIDSTEFGDSWPDAMAKINAMFHHVYHIIEGKSPVAGVKGTSVLATTSDAPAPVGTLAAAAVSAAAAHERIAELEHTISGLQQKVEAMLAMKAAPTAAPNPRLAKLLADARAAEAAVAAALSQDKPEMSSDDTLKAAVDDAAKAAS